MKHGVTRENDGTHGFYWLGKRLTLEELNEQLKRTVSEMKCEVDAVAQGMDLGANIDAAKITLAKLDAVREVLELPLCRICKKLVREKWL